MVFFIHCLLVKKLTKSQGKLPQENTARLSVDWWIVRALLGPHTPPKLRVVVTSTCMWTLCQVLGIILFNPQDSPMK